VSATSSSAGRTGRQLLHRQAGGPGGGRRRCGARRGRRPQLRACARGHAGRPLRDTGAIHLAALPSAPRSIQDPLTTNAVTVTGTLNVVPAARDAGTKRAVFASSSSVQGPGAGAAEGGETPSALRAPTGSEWLRGSPDASPLQSAHPDPAPGGLYPACGSGSTGRSNPCADRPRP